MKFRKWVDAIRSLPEETRRLLAGATMVIAVALLLTGWSATLSSRLGTLSPETPPILVPSVSEEGTSAPGVALIETLRNLTGVRALLPAGGDLALASPAEALGILKESLSTLWRYLSDPFR